MTPDNEALTTEEIKEDFQRFGKDDFKTSDEPYRILVATLSVVPDEITRLRIVNIVQDMAKAAGCPNGTFQKMLKAAEKGNCLAKSGNHSYGFTGIKDLLNDHEPNYGIYTCSDEGVELYDPMNNQTTFVCSHPVFPTRRYTNIETESEMLDISFVRDGKWRTKKMIARQTIAQARQIACMSEFGISVTSENAKEMVKYLCTIDDLNRSIIPRTETISRLGWVEGKGFSPYIPNVAYDNVGKFGEAYASVHKQGDFQKWLDIIKQVRENEDNKVAQIMVAASVASVILKWTCNQPFMVHLWSTHSGTGKTIATMLAASVWADPANGKYVKSLNSTTVAFEQMAAFCNNLPLCLDELQTIQKNSDFEDIIYMLCEGTGRARSTRNLGVREQSHWLNTIITNGEQSLTNEGRGGAINRVIDLETAGLVMPGDQEDMSRIADTLRENFGFAGEMIVSAISNDKTLPDKISEKYRMFVKILMKTATGKQANYGAALLAADWLFDQVVTKDGLQLTPENIGPYLATPDMVDMNSRARERIIDFVAINSSNFRNENDSESEDFSREIYGKKSNDGKIYILQNVLRKELSANRYDYTAFLKWCQENKYIETYYNARGERHWGIPTEIPGVGKTIRAVCFLPEMFKPIESKSGMTVVKPDDLPF